MTDNSLHSASVVERRPNLIADLVMGRITPAPIWQQRHYRLKFLLRTALFYAPTRSMLEPVGACGFQSAARRSGDAAG